MRRLETHLFSSIMLLNDTAMSPRAMTMLLRMAGSVAVSEILKSSGSCDSQNCELTHMSFDSARTLALRKTESLYLAGLAQMSEMRGPYTDKREPSPKRSSDSRM